MKLSKAVLYCAAAAMGLLSSGCATTGTPATARAEVASSLAAMGAAANAHDVDRHVGFYANDSSTLLIFDGEAIHGFDAIRSKQREWWSAGKTDVAYTAIGTPDVRILAPDLAVTTLFMKSRRTTPNGTLKEGSLAVSALWQKRSGSWKVIYSHESTSH
jgi:uncharacterized protein (TIGR02246 family)